MEGGWGRVSNEVGQADIIIIIHLQLQPPSTSVLLIDIATSLTF